MFVAIDAGHCQFQVGQGRAVDVLSLGGFRQFVGATLKVAPVDDNGDVLLDEYEKLLGPRTRLVAMTQVSNALGTVPPVAQMIASAHRHGALALVDGAQSVSHKRTDVQTIDADFFVLSGHKMFAPTGRK